MTGALGCDSAPHYLEIRDWHDLYAVRGNLGGHYGLMNDLDSTTAGYGELAGTPPIREGAVGGLMGGNLGGTVAMSYSAGSMNGDEHVGGLVER